MIAGILLLLGCGTPSGQLDGRSQLSSEEQLAAVLERNIAETGSLKLWSGVGWIKGEAVTTIRESDGGAWYVDQTHQFAPGQGDWLRVLSNLPEGVQLEQLDRQGRLTRKLTRYGGSGEPQELRGGDWAEEAAVLRLLGQAMTQGYGLMRGDWTRRYLGLERKGGRLSHKIEITGVMIAPGEGTARPKGQKDQLVVWIDSETYLMDRLLLRYGNELGPKGGFSYLGANVGGYQEVGEGMTLPTYIGVVRSDRYHQFSEHEIWRFEYQDLQVRGGS